MGSKGFDFVASSETRLRIVSSLSIGARTPTELASKSKKHLSHVSRALKELEKQELVHCINPEYSKDRKYTLTREGSSIAREFEKYQLWLRLF
jgi:predicted transcriptional regulator